MDIFGHNKPIRDFFIAMGCMLGGTLIGDLLFGLTSHQEKLIDWPSFTFFVFLSLLVTASYFIGRLIAYKTHLFPKADDRDNVLICIFIVLSLASIVLSIILI